MSEQQTKREKVKLKLVGLNGNAFNLLGAFRRQASNEGWTEPEIEAVTKDAMSGDYQHLLSVLSDNCVNGGCGTDDDEDYD